MAKSAVRINEKRAISKCEVCLAESQILIPWDEKADVEEVGSAMSASE